MSRLEQENLDEKMIGTGTSAVPALPSGPHGERESFPSRKKNKRCGESGRTIADASMHLYSHRTYTCQGHTRGRRRGRGVTEVTGRDGDVM